MLLLVLLFLFIALIVSIARFRVHPFLALLLTGLAVGFAGGLRAPELVKPFIAGFGDTIERIGLVIALGAVLGTSLERSGGARTLAHYLLHQVGLTRAPLALSLVGWMIAIPVFCDAGFVLMAPLLQALRQQTGYSIPLLAVALATGLYATHVFVPPTPGPLAAAATLGADVGLVLLLGMLVSLPTAAVGLLWAHRYAARFSAEMPVNPVAPVATPTSPLQAFIPIALPVMLIALRSIALAAGGTPEKGFVPAILDFIGHPAIALLIGVLLALTLKAPPGEVRQQRWIAEGLTQAGSILLITGAGGALGHVLQATGLGDHLGAALAAHPLGLWIPFLIAAALKSAQGSSTVALITTSALMVPLLPTMELTSELARVLVVLAIGAGAMVVSHLNDSYFWVVAQFSGMETATALRTFSLATLLQGLAGMLAVTTLYYLLT
jgi:GntP family gluconate:H+ symporter